MSVKRISGFVVTVVACGVVVLGMVGVSFADDKGAGGHRHYKGEVVEKAGKVVSSRSVTRWISPSMRTTR